MNIFGKSPDYETLIRKHIDFDIALFAAGAEAPSESELGAFETTIGYKLPKDFREFSKSTLGGLYVEVKEEKWPRPKLYDVAPFWSFLYGFAIFGFSVNIPEWMDITKITPEFMTSTQSRNTPFMQVMGDPNLYCFDSKGNTLYWDHETNEFETRKESLFTILEFELTELMKRKAQKIQAHSP